MNLILAAELFGNGGGGLYQKHAPTEIDSLLAFDTYGNNVIQDVLISDNDIVAVSNRSSKSTAIIDRNTEIVTRLSITPSTDPSSDSTDLPEDMTDFYKSGVGIACRSITETQDYYVIGLRYAAGATIDGTHLYGGVVFINKSTKTVAKSYWLPYIVSRVVYDAETNLLAVGLQKAGLIFYTVSGYTLTEAETFLYDWSQSQFNGRESQAGCFYTDTITGKRMYANCGFGSGVRFYDVSDPTDITYVNELWFRNTQFSGIPIHTYTCVAKFPYMYLTIARDVTLDEPDPEHDGVLTIDISDLSNIEVLHFEHIAMSDGLIFNGFGDSKPTEMKCSQNMLYLNYEQGYLAFEIDATGKSTHYCGRYLDDVMYGLATLDGTEVYIGLNGSGSAYIGVYTSDAKESITNSLTHVSNSNSASKVNKGASYSATLTEDTGYEMGNVSVTMGGVDITSTAYNSETQSISIPSVTDSVIITATASSPETVYWQPSDAELNQYQASKPATISLSGSNLSVTMPMGNSGFKTTKTLVESPTTSLTLKLIADSVTISEPSGKVMYLQILFKKNGSIAKYQNYVTPSTTSYIEDIATGISKTFNAEDIAEADEVQVAMRTDNVSDEAKFPVAITFTNLRLIVV